VRPNRIQPDCLILKRSPARLYPAGPHLRWKKMKHLLTTVLLLATVALVGCSETKSRDFFAAGGIAIGAPATLG
jgi:hypothetical protein